MHSRHLILLVTLVAAGVLAGGGLAVARVEIPVYAWAVAAVAAPVVLVGLIAGVARALFRLRHLDPKLTSGSNNQIPIVK
jgi:hypothetical protein